MKTLEAIGVDALVIRHPEVDYYEQLLGRQPSPLLMVEMDQDNIQRNHYLICSRLREEFGSFEGLNIVIAGDIAHSRVARSNADALTKIRCKCNIPLPDRMGRRI